jgi:hypothetical protein
VRKATANLHNSQFERVDIEEVPIWSILDGNNDNYLVVSRRSALVIAR